MLKSRSAPHSVPWMENKAVMPMAGSSAETAPFVRRRLSPAGGHALEILGHAIEYLADEYAADLKDKGPLGNADPRIEAIQVLKGLNRAVYYSGTEIEPVARRVRRWLLGTP